jgi:hypothetical protein
MPQSITRLVKGKSEIFDPVRKKYVALTPEENVRQDVLRHLLHKAGYPSGNISVEKQLLFNGMLKRYDVLVYNSSFSPALLIECKSPSVPLNEKICRQIAMYNLQLQVPYLWLTNGRQHFIVKNDLIAGTYNFLPALPNFSLL